MKIDYNGHTFTICSGWKTSDSLICRNAISNEPQMGEIWFWIWEIKQYKNQLIDGKLPFENISYLFWKEYNAFRKDYDYVVEKYEKLIALE